MGGDQIVAALAGDEVEHSLGDEIRAAENTLYLEMIAEVEPMPDARRLIEELRRRGWSVVLASSAKPDEIDRYLELLDARQLVHGWTTSADVEATKPSFADGLSDLTSRPGSAQSCHAPHHLDENPRNNAASNLIVLCAECHHGEHQGPPPLAA